MLQTNYSQSWYQRATVRTKSPIALSTNSSLPFFPEELLPICNHRLITQSKKIDKDYLLIQICYKYLYEVCITETEVVNHTCLNIAYDKLSCNLPEDLKADAFLIMLDESYHSYLARNLMLQIQRHTGIQPITHDTDNEVTKAIRKLKLEIPSELHRDFEFIAACIAENVFTEEIVKISRFKNVNESFHQIMQEHASDEGRHASYFVGAMSEYWKHISEATKQFFSKIIPLFISYCLDGVHDNEFLIKILMTCNLNEDDIKILIQENTSEVGKINKNARINNIIRFLKRSNVLSYTPLVNGFKEMRIL